MGKSIAMTKGNLRWALGGMKISDDQPVLVKCCSDSVYHPLQIAFEGSENVLLYARDSEYETLDDEK